MTVPQKLALLREKMRAHGVNAVIVTTEDFHGSEYVGEHFKLREYLSGFDGSAGTLAVTERGAALWTDGRYFLQAERQLSGSGIALMKQGEKDVPKLAEYLADELCEGQTAAADGRTLSLREARVIEKALAKKGAALRLDEDIAGEAWDCRPPLSANPVWELSARYAGESRASKLKRLRGELSRLGADVFAVSALDEIAWALNLRGGDVAYNPVFLAYMLLDGEGARLFAQESAFSAEIRGALAKDGVELLPYNGFYAALAELAGRRVLLDPACANTLMARSLPQDARLIEAQSPVQLMKARKNEAEINGERAAHIKDGAAVTRFIYWLKHNVAGGGITELSAAQKLEELRRGQDGYLGESFAPIIGYGAHGAIVHYSANEQTNAQLLPRGLVLCDTGGHYREGTTDITRTVALGELTDEEKRCFTLVLAGHLELAAAVFPKGARGANLDYAAREPLWRAGLDFNHGTGHGVGHILNVHEGPQRIRWRISDGVQSAPLEAGMVTSDEPGVYVEGRFGVRHENLVLCKERENTRFGSFLCFEPLTLVPFDLDAVDAALLTERERGLLNSYHERVYREISGLLPENEREWLKKATAAI